MSATPNYASNVTVGAATLTTGDTSRAAPVAANAPVIFNPANGGQCERIVVEPLGNTTQSVVRIFRYDGANFHLYTEVQLAPLTAVAAQAITPTTLEAVNFPNLFPILVPTGWTLRASLNDNQAAGVKVQAEGGGY
jgi:hypothetical protein